MRSSDETEMSGDPFSSSFFEVQMPEGKVKKVIEDKGFGFIEGEGGDIFFQRWDSDGIKLYTRLAGTGLTEIGVDIAVDDGGMVYIAGETNGEWGGPSAGSTDFFVAAFTSEGGIEQWVWQGGSVGQDQPYGIAASGEGEVYIIGDADSSFEGEMALGQGDFITAKACPPGN